MNQKITGRILGAAVALLALGPAAAPAYATEGYFQNGYGARQKALAGAGVADGNDATTISLNPAGLVHVGNEWDTSVTLFSPHRKATITATGGGGFTPAGTHESENTLFPIPNSAMSYRLNGNPLFDVIGYSMYGNGGMNTEYKNMPNPNCVSGMFCDGKAGVNLQQMFLSVAGAKRFGNVAVGVAPIFAVQMFEAKGILPFGGISTDSGNLSGRDTDVSFGGGMRAGIEWAVMPNVRLGVAGTSPIWMQKLDRYSGLFAEQGGFDIPASLQAGIAVDVTPAVTLMADYKRIWYSGVAAVSNPATNYQLGPSGFLGADNGAGFGWKDVDIFKLGVEWRASPSLTLRGGYAYNTQPLQSRDVMFNILAPGVVQHHITGGLQYKLTSNLDLELATMFAPEASVKGSELPGFGTNGIELSMWQFEVTAGIKYHFGGGEPPRK